MNEAYRCPNCGSLGTRYRRTTGDHICQQCGHQWAILGVRSRPNRIKGAAITAVIGTVVGIGCAVGQGDFGVLIIAAATWVYTFFLLWRQSKRYSDEAMAKVRDANRLRFVKKSEKKFGNRFSFPYLEEEKKVLRK